MQPDQSYEMGLSTASFEEIADILEEAGFDAGVIMMTADGRTVAGLELGNLMIYDIGGPDQRINSGVFSDYETALGEEAFNAGYAAGMHYGVEYGDLNGPCASAWDAYTPSDALHELKTHL